MAGIKTYKLKVSEVITETYDTKTIRFRLDQPIDFKPGQFAMLTATIEHNGKKESVTRPYSFASSQTKKDYVDFTIKEVPGGLFSTYAVRKCKAGDLIELKGPYGQFIFKDDEKEIVLLGAGCGIIPLMSMIRYIADKRLPTKVTFLDSNKTPDDMLYYEELKKLQKENKNMNFVFTITRPEGTSWKGITGRFDKNILPKYIGTKNSIFYISGPPPFTEALVAALKELGVDNKRIKIERYH